MATTPPKPLVVIGIGANLGDREAAIVGAINAIEALSGVEIVARSSLWQSRPVGGPPQPEYYNAAVGVRTALAPQDLLKELLSIERSFGRIRTVPNAPRTLDLDILWVEATVLRSGPREDPPLEVPHPRLRERAFALIPLLEVAPGAADPRTGELYATILAELGTEGVSPLDS